ncbi:MAG: class I SAM-dependent methyltransferase [Actinomycetes bacterium]
MADDAVEATLSTTLDSLDGAHNYRDWILALARPYLEAPVLEVGAGTGTFTGHLAEVGGVTAVEPAGSLAAALRTTHDADPRVSVVEGLIADVPAVPAFGSAVLTNVLEHIDDDAGALRDLHDRLLPGGSLVLWVPAFALLHSRFDDELGHHRRYRLAPLRDLVSAAGFTVVEARYVNVVGWFAWLIVARLLGRVPTATGAVSTYDRFVIPTLRRVETAVRVPFGQSVFLAARKPLAG